MTLSGTYTFGVSTDFSDVLQEAWERCGKRMSELSGNDLDSALRSAQYVFADWSNRQVNLWKVEQRTTALTQGQQSLAMNTYDLFITEAATRTTSGGVNNDLIVSPMSRSEYLAIPNKAQQSSRPTQYYLQRTITPTVYFWPTPQDATITFVYNVAVFQQDVGAYTNTLDVPQRWFDALASAIAYRLSVKFVPERADKLEALADKAYAIAAAEDTENVPLRIIPDSLGRRFG